MLYIILVCKSMEKNQPIQLLMKKKNLFTIENVKCRLRLAMCFVTVS